MRIAAPAIVSRARSISASGIRSRPRCRRPARAPCRTTQLGGGEILDGEPERLEDGQLVGVGPARMRAGEHLAELGARCAPRRARRAAGRPPRSASTRAGRRRGVAAAIVSVSSSRALGMLEPTAFTCAPGCEPLATRGSARARSCRCRRRRRRAATVLGRAAVAACSSVRISAFGEHGAHRLGVRARLDAGAEDRERRARPGRASARVATAETAAVRISVIARRVQDRAQLAGLAVVEQDGALVRVEPAGRVARARSRSPSATTPSRSPPR